jgi:hypothetical protein
MRAASGRDGLLEKEDLRDHNDIDIYVFDEQFIDFLKLFSKDEYDIWHTPIAGLNSHAVGEFHSVSLRDKENDVDIGLFRAVAEGDGRLVTTNIRRVFHPGTIFNEPPVALNGMKLKIMSPEWLYYMSIFQSGEKRKDGQLIVGEVDFDKFNKMQLLAYETGSDAFSYFKFITDFDVVLKNADVLTHL